MGIVRLPPSSSLHIVTVTGEGVELAEEECEALSVLLPCRLSSCSLWYLFEKGEA